MPNPNSYECKACGATFNSQDELDGHNSREHPSGAKVGAGAGSESQGSSGNPSERKNM